MWELQVLGNYVTKHGVRDPILFNIQKTKYIYPGELTVITNVDSDQTDHTYNMTILMTIYIQ